MASINPTTNEAAGMQLPAPIVEQLPVQGAPIEAAPPSAEQAPAAPEFSPPVPTATMAVPPTIPLPIQPDPAQMVVQSDVSVTTSVSGGVQIDDGDLIEKEWVEKAKAIVDRNRYDPYRQNEELTVFKADYMQKRYNKSIKLNK